EGGAITRVLSAFWLAGTLCLVLKLLATALVLRRRLAACRPVTDASLLSLLETTRRQVGLERTPALLVTPESLSPCTVGTWNPRIVLPESVVTQASSTRLRHVLAHELAHLARGDLWTNWLLLAVRALHWCNPVAWWTVREMQAEREAACDELAFAALGEAERSAYAATIVELAAGLAPFGSELVTLGAGGGVPCSVRLGGGGGGGGGPRTSGLSGDVRPLTPGLSRGRGGGRGGEGEGWMRGGEGGTVATGRRVGSTSSPQANWKRFLLRRGWWGSFLRRGACRRGWNGCCGSRRCRRCGRRWRSGCSSGWRCRVSPMPCRVPP